jgi:cytochrome c peroxidase
MPRAWWSPTRGLSWTAVVLIALPAIASTSGGDPPRPSEYLDEEAPLVTTWSAAKSALGQRLFAERLLSRDRTVSCADCHQKGLAFTDGKKTAVGIGGQVGTRNTPTLVNRALGRTQFWDGRAATLEEQALGPIANPAEMNLTVPEAVERLAAVASYREAFRAVFGGDPTAARLAEALAAYERTLYAVDAPFDRYLAGQQDAMSPAAQRGLVLFGRKARCGDCHAGPNFTDEAFHCLGVSHDPGRSAVTRDTKDFGSFKTPTLREVARTAPYMHNGSMATLAEVVEYYDKGGEPHPNLDEKMKPLSLTAGEKADLVAFMEALSGTVVEGAALEGKGGIR